MMDDGGWMMGSGDGVMEDTEDGGWMIFLTQKNAKRSFISLKMLMSARALRSAKGCCVFWLLERDCCVAVSPFLA